MSKIAIIGDTHCRTKYINEYEQTKKAILNILVKEKPTLIVFLGDDLHNHSTVHSAQLSQVIDFLMCAREIAYTIKLIGNHEIVSPNSYLRGDHHFHSLHHLEGIEIIDKPTIISNVLFVPYVPVGMFNQALEEHNANNWDVVELCFAHQEFRGVKVGSQVSTSDDVWDLTKPRMVSGHIHDRHQVQENLIYPGSPAQFTHADAEDKSILILEDEKIKYVPVEGNILYKTYHLDLTKDAPDSVSLDLNNRNRVIVKGGMGDLKSFRSSKVFKDFQKNGVTLVPKLIVEETTIKKAKKKTFNEIMEERMNEELRGLWNEIKD